VALRRLVRMALLLAILALVGGCGSGGVTLSDPGDAPLIGKIREYVGDGHGGTKSWPSFLPSPAAADRVSRLPYRLDYGLTPKQNRIRRRKINWYALPPTAVGAHPGAPVITLQPTANEDSDLFVLEGKGANYWNGADSIGYSIRLPSPEPDQLVLGYAPDWVAFDTGPTSGEPTAQIAVYGTPGDPPYRYYHIESDWAWELQVNGPSLRQAVPQYNSDWNFFEASSGVHYTVHMTAHDGDPDIFVYEDESTEFVDSDTSTGNASIGFTAGATSRHYIRAYGYAAANNDPEVWVTSP
jgi:hypothetical protein